MRDTKPRLSLRLARVFFIVLALSFGVASIVTGPARFYATACRMLAKGARSYAGAVAKAELHAVKKEIDADRHHLAAAREQRDEMRLRIDRLIALENDLLARKSKLRDRGGAIRQALDQTSNTSFVQVNGQAYRRADVRRRALSLEVEEEALREEIAETNRTISRLTSGFADLDRQIALAEEKLDARERTLLLTQNELEGTAAGAAVLESLHSLQR